jgi:flagellar hook-associated protein 1 FlgK
MTISLGVAPASGDQYLLQPTRFLSRGFATLISDPRALAIAGPVKSSVALTNLGNGRIDAPTVTDYANPALLTPTQFVFANPPTAYQVNGTGPLVPYSAGAAINLNGWVVTVSGTPAAGDSFRIDPNSNGRGDNRNGLAMAGLQTQKFLVGGTASYQDAYSQLVGRIGSRTQQAQISRDALAIQREAAQAARDEISSVNLDEEAANLLRFQQAFQAAAQLIQVTNEAFRSLIDLTR